MRPGFPLIHRLGRSLLRTIRANDLLLFALLFPACVRTIPEILAGPWPLGTDTVWIYAPFIKNVETHGWTSAFIDVGWPRTAPVVFLLFAGVSSLSNADPFLLTKAAGPIFHGLLVFAMYYFARHGLGWDRRRCLLVVLVSSLYFVPLRFSWDMYKNALGYATFILALTWLRQPRDGMNNRLVLALAAISIFSSELTAILWIGFGGILLLYDARREKKWNPYLLLVAAIAFLASLLYSGILIAPVPPVSPLAPLPNNRTFLYNYVGADDDLYTYPGIGAVYVHVAVLSAIILGPLLPLAWAGFFPERRLRVWTLILAAAAFSILIVPFAAFPLWHRWLFMLAFPALIFAVNCLARLPRYVVALFFAVLVILCLTFVTLPPELALPYYASPYTVPYVPSSMIQNTVPIYDSPEIVAALRWLNEQHFENSTLVTPIAFLGWSELYSQGLAVYGYVKAWQVDNGNFSAFQHVFLLYWAPSQGWYDPNLMPLGMVPLYMSGRIAIYEQV